jgi:hypothetical protein
VIGKISAGVLLAATLAAVCFVALSGGGSVGSGTAEGAFGAHYAGLEERRLEARVPTMGDTSAGGDHIHPFLAVYVNGERIALPANIGIGPGAPLEDMAGLHTHDDSGTVHVENAEDPTLSQFFEIWGVPFSSRRLGPYKARGDDAVRMWVDGGRSQAFGELVLEDGQEIVLAYGPKGAPPPPELK